MTNAAALDHRVTQKRVRIRIPQAYHGEPVISNLISDYQLTVNIVAALLGANAKGDGWFDLDLQGEKQQIDSALIYLNDLNLEIWDGAETDGW